MTAKPALKLMIGDKELRAIGHVAAQWAYLETQIDGVILVLINQPSTQALKLKPPQSFKRRMEMLRKSARIVLEQHTAELTALLAIATDASSLRDFRDDIVHGHWKLHRKNGTGPLTTGIKVFNQGPPFKVKEIPFTAEKAENIAAQISKVNLRLVLWCEQNIP
ncbi:MAG: hypothetical protein DID92_2727744307 [Candidatus Nitrotoga sp. SPKER]|nr:MAG: hypothetical protein DID92_2727744307 [Candidatus Nitrotoga sp. SPKER]